MRCLAPPRRAFLAAAGSLALCTVPVVAQNEIPVLPEIPAPVAATHRELTQERAQLVVERASLHRRSDEQTARCSSVVEGSAQDAQCISDRTALGAAVQTHIARSDAFVAALRQAQCDEADALDSRLAALARTIATLERGLSATNVASVNLQSDVDAWIKMGEGARTEAQMKAVASMMELTLSHVEKSSSEQLAFHQESVARFKQWYKNYEQVIPEYQRVTSLANIENMKNVQDRASVLSQLLEAVNSGAKMGESGADERYIETVEEGGLSLLKLSRTYVETDPEIHEAITSVEAISDQTYGWMAVLIARARAQQLIDLQGQNLSAIDALGRAYIRSVEATKKLKAQRLQLACEAARKASRP